MQTKAIVKLNQGSWFEHREKLIQQFKAEGTLDTYSDEWVRTKDTIYKVIIIPVNSNFLDPLIGFEGMADASDLLRFIDNARNTLLKDYIPYTGTNTVRDPLGAKIMDPGPPARGNVPNLDSEPDTEPRQ